MEYIDLFNLKVVRNEKESDFFISQGAISNILINKYSAFETQIPNYDGTTNTYTLKQKRINSYPVTLYTDGVKVETKTKPKYISYLIYNERNEVKGNLCVNKENTIGLYYINDDKVMITSRTVGVPTEECLISKIEEVDENLVQCGNDDNGSVENVEKNSTKTYNKVTSVNNTYCVKVLWLISYPLYSQLINAQNYTIEEFIETLNNVLNQAYNTGNNESTFQFEINGIISYTTANDEPNWGYDLYNVGNYAYNNYFNTYGYDIVYRIDSGGPPGIAGQANCGAAYGYYGDNERASVGWFWTAPQNLDTSTYNSFYDRLETTVHEIGHNFGLAHTFQNNCQGFYNQAVCPSSCGSSPCNSVMSYCPFRQLEFHPARMDNLNDFVSTYGESLLCNVTPNEPYLKLEIIDTNIIGPNFIYTIELRDCDNNDWYEIETGLNYNDFPKYLIISELPFNANCYAYKVTVDGINAFCEGIENIN